MHPDYSLYGITDRAYGFLTRGCPRGCDFCHVAAKEGKRSYKVADLEEFWDGQKHIDILDPNILACKDWGTLIESLARTRSWVDFNQGLDIRVMNEEKAQAIADVKTEAIHFAWDRYEDRDMILPKFQEFKRHTKLPYYKLLVYVLCNYNTTLEQDLERIYALRDLGYDPYVMLYDKQHLPRGHRLHALARWVNNKTVFHALERFEDYTRRGR